uniref:Chromo domain-containing protein n=1 Tax=Globodera rostochiensis TaxID=31243 RepID=A0A914HRS5_GLORO
MVPFAPTATSRSTFLTCLIDDGSDIEDCDIVCSNCNDLGHFSPNVCSKAAATVSTSSSSSTTTATSKRVQKRRRNYNNKKKEKLLVLVPKGKIPSRVSHDPGLPEDTFEVSKVLAAYNGERMYYLEWKNWRGNDLWVRSSWSDSLEITASFVEDSTIDAVLSALAGEPVAHHLLVKLEKHELFQQLKTKLGTGAVLSTAIAFSKEATEKQRTVAAASLIDFVRKKMEG